MRSYTMKVPVRLRYDYNHGDGWAYKAGIYDFLVVEKQNTVTLFCLGNLSYEYEFLTIKAWNIFRVALQGTGDYSIVRNKHSEGFATVIKNPPPINHGFYTDSSRLSRAYTEPGTLAMISA